MSETKREHENFHYNFYGPNATLIDWLDGSQLAKSVLEKAQLEQPTLWQAFSKNNPEQQHQAGKKAIKSLWHAYPELGPYPFLETLSDYEFKRQFYPDYREHCLHQLRSYWLGLYLFDTCRPIQEENLRETERTDAAASTDVFLRRWCACALYHDIGYILENEGANSPSGPAWREICHIFSETLYTPLSTLPVFREAGLTEVVERSIIENFTFFAAVINPWLKPRSTRGKICCKASKVTP